jgi:hypothetical protein
VSAIQFGCLLFALCFLFGEKGKISPTSDLPLALVLTYFKDLEK